MPKSDAMNREARAALAAETLSILKAGRYGAVDLSERLARSAAGTSAILPNDQLEWAPPAKLRPTRPPTAIDMLDADTLAAAARLAARGCNVVALNFASAKHAGGGWLRGAQAQEESVTRRSTLYASLTSEGARGYYDEMARALRAMAPLHGKAA